MIDLWMVGKLFCHSLPCIASLLLCHSRSAASKGGRGGPGWGGVGSGGAAQRPDLTAVFCAPCPWPQSRAQHSTAAVCECGAIVSEADRERIGVGVGQGRGVAVITRHQLQGAVEWRILDALPPVGRAERPAAPHGTKAIFSNGIDFSFSAALQV